MYERTCDMARGRKKNNWLLVFPDVVGDVRVNLRAIEDRIDQSAGPMACWSWRGGSHRQGYGMIGGYRIATKTKLMVTVHRVLLKQKLGYDPGLQVDAVHTCGNMRCVNPAHIIPGNARLLTQIKRQNGRKIGGRAVGWRARGPRQQRFYRYGAENIRELGHYIITPEEFAERNRISVTTARRILRYIESGRSYAWARKAEK
jgi:hypothetical protein